MLKDTERLKVALRVITAITDCCEPEEADVEALRSYVVVFMDKPSDD